MNVLELDAVLPDKPGVRVPYPFYVLGSSQLCEAAMVIGPT